MGARRNMLRILALLLFVCSGALLLRQVYRYGQAERSGEEARDAAGVFQSGAGQSVEQPPNPPLEPDSGPAQAPLEERARFLWDVDLANLRQTNGDVLGWITVPGTPIDYPYLQSGDNQHYLNHTWQNERSGAGSIFLECKVSPDFSDFNTIVYGHNMSNGSMFGSLRQYRTQSHYEANPYIYVVNDSGIRRYEIFAAFEAEVVSYTYRLGIRSPELKQAFLDYSRERSVIHTGVEPTVDDCVITLSTCTGNGYDTRWVVQGVLTGVFTQGEESLAPAVEH